ncbi:probable replication factor C subunit 1 isoform X2 [Halichondria panicea]|uniref:probable replication factor C subunit 1 isoform X2 n=1 Tax=Halichondria panicea TaxID=6063 RepID=UPI00312B6656
MDGLITAFFKPLVKRTIIDVDGPCIIASTSASVHDTSPRPSRPSTAPPHAVESVPLVHVCQREPIEEKFTSRYLHSPPPRPVTTPTGGVGDLCDWREVPPTVQPLQGHCTPNSLLPRYQERTPPLTSDLTLSIRVTKRRRKIAVDKTAYPQHSTNLHSDLWVHTYRPLTCDEVCGNAESCSYLYQWLTNHVQCCRDDYEEDPTNALLLYGPPGSGKTAAVYAVASQLGIRVSPSHLHKHPHTLTGSRGQLLFSEGQRKSFICSQRSNSISSSGRYFHSNIFCDSDRRNRGFWSTIEDLLHTTKRPFILTAHDEWLPLDTPYTSITFTRPPKEELSVHLQALALCHNVNLSSEAANQIAESLNCDIRRAFNYLQLWLCWSPSNLPMLPSNSFIPPPQYDTACDVDILSPHARVRGWWCVTPMDSLCDDVREARTCEGVESVWADLTTRTSYPSHSRVVWNEWAERVSQCLPHHRVLSRVAMVTDVLPLIRVICNTELQRKTTNTKRRFTHYLKQTDIVKSDLMKPPQLS